MLQLMPEATEDMAEKLEKILAELPSVTEMISGGMGAMDIAFRVTDGFSMLMENKTASPEYKCKCSKERMERALVSIGKEEIQSIIDEQGEAEMCCQFCNSKYTFGKDELLGILAKAK